MQNSCACAVLQMSWRGQGLSPAASKCGVPVRTAPQPDWHMKMSSQDHTAVCLLAAVSSVCLESNCFCRCWGSGTVPQWQLQPLSGVCQTNIILGCADRIPYIIMRPDRTPHRSDPLQSVCNSNTSKGRLMASPITITQKQTRCTIHPVCLQRSLILLLLQLAMSPTLLLSQPTSSSLLRLPRAPIRHQRSLACAFKPAAMCRSAGTAQHQQRNHQPADQQHNLRQAATMAAPLLSLLASGAAFAEETAADAAADAAYAAAYAQDSGATDTIVTLMAVFVFVLLLLVTGGVSRCCCCCWHLPLAAVKRLC